MNVVDDDLLKPVTRDRLELTLERLRTDRRSQDFSVLPEANHLRQIPCFGQHMVYFLKIDAVECVESRAVGVCVTDLEGVERPTAVPLNILQRRTPLLRCHRQFLVNVDQVQKLRYVDSGLV